MALIKCRECSNSVSEYANNCPQCGCPIGVGKLTLTRKKRFGDFLTRYSVYKNGVDLGQLQNGDSFSIASDSDFNVRVIVTFGNGRQLSGDLAVQKGMTKVFEVKPGLTSVKFTDIT